jgi:uncharacterized protein
MTIRLRARLARELATAALVFVATVGIGGYLAVSYAVAERFTHAARYHVGRGPQVAASTYEDVALRTSDGLTLRGWYFPVAGDRAAIVVHGKDSNRVAGENRNAEKIADFLIANGYSVLLFDLRGHGDSDGDRFSLGYQERLDVAAGIDYLVARGVSQRRVALVGISMGAGTVLQTLLIRPDVGAVVADSSYMDARTLLEERLEDQANVPSWFTPGVILAAKTVFGLDGDQVRPVEVVRAHPEKAFLFIHCENDGLIAVDHAHALRAASTNPQTTLWVASGCRHAWAFQEHPTEYEVRVLRYLETQLPQLPQIGSHAKAAE